jgi:predicted metalloendopeptidase
MIRTLRTISRSTLAILATLASVRPLALRAQDAGTSKPSPLLTGVDPHTRPGDDFFAYANGEWLHSTPIPAGMERWGARNEIDQRTRQRIVQLLDDAATAPPGSNQRRIADFRAAWLDDATIEAHGIEPLRSALDTIDQLRDNVALTRYLGRETPADVDPLNWGIYRSSHILGLSVEPSIHGERSYVAFLLQGGLGLGDRENYLGTSARAEHLRIQYFNYITTKLRLAGFDHADLRAGAVLALEISIAGTQATHEATENDHNADHVWMPADFVRNAPGIDWPAFLAAAGLDTTAGIVAWQPSAVTGMASLVASEPVAMWQDYLRFHLLDDNADILPHQFADAARTMHDAISSAPAPASRAQRALDATMAAMSDEIGPVYAERYFPADQKRRVQDAVAGVAAAFARRVASATWMSAATRSLALEKLRTLYIGIGYPERWPADTALVIDPHDPVGNLGRVAAERRRRAVSQIGLPVDRSDWWIAPQTVGAILIFQQNAYEFSAGLLQPPRYDPRGSDAATYGAIGAIIGHDISHFIDRLGAEYDTTGAMRRWWQGDELARFDSLARPLVDQFSQYHPFPDASVNGALTASENIADLAGLSAALDAFHNSIGARASDTAYVAPLDREFFLAFARSWRVRLSDSAMRAQLGQDHAPEMYRVATVRNLDAWYRAFGVKPGDRLYLPPAARVRIW